MRALNCALILLAVLSAQATSAACAPEFPYADGWLGGDGVFSIALEAGRVLWLFDDSFVDGEVRASRAGSKLIANTVAISTCQHDDWNIRYFHTEDRASGSPQAFFDSGTDRYRYWPLDGFLSGGSLYVFLLEVATSGTGPFAFKPIGARLAKVSNPEAQPGSWNIQYRDLECPGGIVPCVSAVVSAPFVYLFAVISRNAPGTHQAILARIRLDHLDSPASGVEYLSAAGSWKSGLDERDAQVVIAGAAPEFSVRYHPEIAQWLMVQTGPGFPAGRIGIRSAERLEGPWSAFHPLYEIPEMLAASAARAEDVFCYAAKEHIEMASSPDSLCVTYLCNSLSFARQTHDLNLYRPRVIDLHFDEISRGKTRSAEQTHYGHLFTPSLAA